MNNEKIKIKISKEFESLGDEFIILLTSRPEYYFDSVLETVKFITDRRMGGVYITTSRPYHFIKNQPFRLLYFKFLFAASVPLVLLIQLSNSLLSIFLYLTLYIILLWIVRAVKAEDRIVFDAIRRRIKK